ncbi:MAG: ATP-dependent RNA helicase RhlB [Pseudomonadales bacterium]|jgi:ATP-dependent RNA helicase RhlB|nr:ATP-dependent RNA helicase RhlB [Pseudomonadales bacterium]MBP9032700.1 ATP-dependent RNA helicase RhlB [Pseudomonadales bacterium]
MQDQTAAASGAAPRPTVTFRELGLPEPLLRAVDDLGFERCTPIQQEVLPYTLLGHDCIGKAQTGTGKTAAFLLTIMNDLLRNPPDEPRYMGEPRALVIAPTRELVLQIGKDAEELAAHADLHVVTLIGGVDYDRQRQQLERKLVDILVATPGRLMDFHSQRQIHLDRVELLVIDEADRMLDMGFIPQVRRIVRQTPPKSHRQTMFFSATFTEEVVRLSGEWTHDPVRVEIDAQSVASKDIDQVVYLVEADRKLDLLLNLLDRPEAASVMIFANRRDQVRRLHERLERAGISCGILSGEVPQQKRVKTLEAFREGSYRVLVATDVAGRGIHVEGVTHVVNFTLPEDPDDYVHRIGRTGRAGASGTSISFACEDDAFLLPQIEQLLGQKLPCVHPDPEMLLARKRRG